MYLIFSTETGRRLKCQISKGVPIGSAAAYMDIKLSRSAAAWTIGMEMDSCIAVHSNPSLSMATYLFVGQIMPRRNAYRHILFEDIAYDDVACSHVAVKIFEHRKSELRSGIP
jgi:hypothetical protein